MSLTLEEFRRAARESGTIQFDHAKSCQKPMNDTCDFSYELLGGTVELRFPACCIGDFWWWMTAGQQVDRLEKMFGIWCIKSHDLAVDLVHEHTSRSTFSFSMPCITTRAGRHRYYCLRDLARATPKTYCVECGARTRAARIAEKYPDEARYLKRLVGENKGWLLSEYEYFCSPQCMDRRTRREERRKEIERLWLKKAGTKLRACRSLIQKKLRQV